MSMIERETFLTLPTDEVAKLVRAAGPQVCVFPINGTRRWFSLEYATESERGLDASSLFLEATTQTQIELYKFIFSDGISTVLTPIFGPDLLERGEEYLEVAAKAMVRLATDPNFLFFYQEYKVRVRFYGDYRKHLGGTKFSYVCDLFDLITKQTAHNQGCQLFYGVFANDATETVAELSVRHFQKTGNIPSRRELIEQYYGEFVEQVSLFIGFDKFSAFDMPLISTGDEDLYFTVSPSLYLTREQFRDILYDHLFTRQGEDPNFSTLQPAARIWLKDFYQVNLRKTLGIGTKQYGVWIPLPQVELPPDHLAGN